MEDNFSMDRTGVGASGVNASNGEGWGTADEASLSLPPLASCCAARFLTIHGPSSKYLPHNFLTVKWGCTQFGCINCTHSHILLDHMFLLIASEEANHETRQNLETIVCTLPSAN